MDLMELRKTAAEVLARDDVSCLIGWQQGSFGFRVKPCIIEEPEEVESLIFSPLCNLGLVNYLHSDLLPAEGRRAIMVRGCDSRALVQLLVEGGIEREELLIIGCSCQGVVDLRKLNQSLSEPLKPADASWQGAEIGLILSGEEEELPKKEVLAESCLNCSYPAPVLADISPGEDSEPLSHDQAEDVKKIEALSLEERWEFWQEEFSRCLRCYSCRNVCPLCYCEDCVLDRLDPTWVYRSSNYSENTVFNLYRAFHLAGRCIDCGQCERVCPMDLKLGSLNRMLAEEINEKYGYQPGLDPEAEPFQASFRPDDREDFIL